MEVNTMNQDKNNFGRRGALFVLLLIAGIFSGYATNGPLTHGWATKPFEQKVFIENKGQFNEKINNGSGKILFGCSNAGVEMYFTPKGLTYRHDVLIPMTEREKESTSAKTREEDGENEGKMKSVPHYLFIEWLGANPNAEIISEEQVSNYYTYSSEKGLPTIKASAYKKIIYKNLYPNIDVEYIFPKDSSGIKYAIILHPGADASLIKMKYTGAEKIYLSADGNVEVKSSFGNFTDHAPVSFLNDHSIVPTSFTKTGNTISFNLQAYDHKQTLIIDPWTTNPFFTGYDAAYDINYDLGGNVYVYGSTAPFQLTKLNSAGVVQWTFSATGFGLYSNLYFYGDFAMDEVSGTSYLVEGLNNNGNPCRVFKINSSGIQTGTFAGSANMNEMWRAEYNHCINKIVITGSGWPGPAYQAAILDTALTTLTPVNVLSSPPNEDTHDMVLLAMDNSGAFCYMATAKSYLFPSTYDNVILKCPVPALVPPVFSVPDGHMFFEEKSINYVPYSFGLRDANGMNGMSASPNYLYTYDSDSLKRWNKNSGAYITGLHISPAAATYSVYPPGTAINIGWGGLSTDDCDNIYAGVSTSIKKYNTSLALTNTFVLPDTVFDVKVGPKNKLYACGKGFATEIININTITPTVTTTGSPATGCNACNGTATVTITGGCNPGPYTYSWMPGGQTTQIATGLCPGQYTVTITTGCVKFYTDTVTITGGSIMSTTLSSTPAACANNGSASVIVSGGNTPYTYSWSPSGQTTSTATGLGGGLYTVTITDSNNCIKTDTISVMTSNTTLSYTLFPGTIACYGDTAGISISVSSGTVIWNTTPAQTGLNAYGLAAGTYTGTITSGGCTSTFTVALTEPPLVVMNPINDLEFCPDVQTPTINFSSTPGGTLANFFWSNSNTAIGLSAGGTGNIPSFTTVNTNSTVISAVISVHASYNGCTGPDSIFTITINPDPIAKFSAQNKVCEGTAMTFTDNSVTGSGTITQWNWDMNNDGIFTDAYSNNPSYTFSIPGTYTVGLIVSTNKLCVDTATLTVYVNPAPLVSFSGDNLQGCPIVSVNFTDHSSIAAPGNITAWQWNFGNGTTFSGQFPPTVFYTDLSSTQVYNYTVSLTVVSDSGCQSTSVIPNYIKVFPVPVANFSYTTYDDGSEGINTPVYFTDQSIGATTVSWYLGDVFAQNQNTNYTNALNPVHTYLYDQPYSYSITEWAYNQYGCVDSITKIVEVKPGFTFYIPNAFSPNADGVNEGFKGTGIGIDNATYHLWIFDRWGNLIFQANDLEKAWDGRIKGKGDIVQEDVYVWKVEFNELKGRAHQYHGIVSVIK